MAHTHSAEKNRKGAAAPVAVEGGFYARYLHTVGRFPDRIAVEMQWNQPPVSAADSAGAQQTSHRPDAGPDGVSRYSYARLRDMAEAIGAWLQRNGIQKNDRCTLLAGNGPMWVAAYLGTLAAGGIAVPFDTAMTSAQVNTLLKDSGSAFLFTDAKFAESAMSAIADLPHVRLVLLEKVEGLNLPDVRTMFMAGAGDFAFVPAAQQDVAVLLYSSGTTGDPKGVMLTHGNLAAEEWSVLNTLELNEQDSILGVLPLFHALAQLANLILPFAIGARVVYLETLNTTELLRGLREREITLFCCVPQFFYLIHEKITRQVAQRGALARAAFRAMMAVSAAGRALGLNPGKALFSKAHQALGPKMRYLITGGSRFDPAIGRELHKLGFDIIQAYGLTETTGGAVVTPPSSNVIGSAGKIMPGNELKIVDVQPGDDAAAEASGEICIRGGIVMKGYWNRPDATAEAIKDGWLHTGDLGYLDKKGNLYITGRKKDVIVLSSGKNIYPEEVEAHYAKSPWIKEICVLGLESKPGEPFSERLHAVIVPDFDLLRERKIVNVNEMVRFDVENLSAQAPPTKRILSYEIWQNELPRTTTRKLKRFEIRKRIQEKRGSGPAGAAAPSKGIAEEDQLWLGDPVVTRAVAIIRRAAKNSGAPLHPSDNLELDLGLDSMERVELLVALEQELGADADEEIVSRAYTVREVVEAVRAGIHNGAQTPRAAGWEGVFATETSDPEVIEIEHPHPLLSRAWFALGIVVNWLGKVFYGLKVEGIEKLPRQGPYIITPNHQSFLDAIFLIAIMPWDIFRQLFYVGTSEIFGSGLWKLVGRSLRLIPVDPDANLVPAMRAGAFGLRRGNILVLFPEGERTIDGSPKTFKKGAAILSTHIQVPIYPVALEGFYDVWPRGTLLPKLHGNLRIRFGAPIFPPANFDRPEAAYEMLTRDLKGEVVEMWEELRGSERVKR